MSATDLPTEVAMTFALLILGMAMATSLRSWLLQNSKLFTASSIGASLRRFAECNQLSRKKVPPQIIVGLDCGGVILDEGHGERHLAEDDRQFSVDDADEGDPAIRHFLRVPMISGTVDGVTKLVEKLGSQNVYIVSKCGPYMEQKIRAWLEYNQFFELTGVSPDNLNFVRERKDKAPLCQKLGVTHFVDNHVEVLEGMQHLGIQGILFAPQEHELNTWYDCCKAGGKRALESPFQLVWNWIDTNRAILEASSALCAFRMKWPDAAPEAERSKFQQRESKAWKSSSAPLTRKAPAVRHKVWSCPVCTLENKDFVLVCEACGGHKPDSWECQTCTLTNSLASLACVACHTRRGCSLQSRES